MTYIARRYELYHHGILGQKWGVRRGPPYPIGAFKFFKKNNHPKKNPGRTRDSENHSNKSKYIKSGIAIAGACLVAYGGYKLYSSGKLDGLVSTGRKFLSRSNLVEGIKPDIPLKEKYTDALGKVNPFDIRTTEGSTNCGYCSISGFLRANKGLDIKANSTNNGSGIDLFGTVERIFTPPNGRWGKNNFREGPIAGRLGNSVGSVGDYLKSTFGDNAQGVAGVEFSIPGSNLKGHAFNWVIENGEVTFYDFQNGASSAVSSSTYFERMFKHIAPNGMVTLVRLDDCEVKMENLNKIGTLAK